MKANNFLFLLLFISLNAFAFLSGGGSGGGGGTWGSITGTLPDQTDLQSALDAKEPTITVLPIAKGGTNSSTALANNKLMTGLTGSIKEAPNSEIGVLDAFSRKKLWYYDTDSIFKLGSWGADGDATNVNSEGQVVYGVSVTGGAIGAGNGGYARIKANRFGLFTIDSTLPAYAGGDYYFRVDPTSLFLKDNSAVKTFEVTRTTGAIKTSMGAGIVSSDASGNLTAGNSGFATNVLHVNKQGNDANSCTVSLPCLTIQRAIDVATAIPSTYNAPVQIEVNPGVYTEDLSFTQQGITLQCSTILYHTSACQLFGGITVNLSGTAGAGFSATLNHVQISGFEVYASGSKNAILFSGTAFQRLFIQESFVNQTTSNSAFSALKLTNTGTSGGTKSTITSRDTDYSNNSSTNATVEIQAGRLFNNGINLDLSNSTSDRPAIVINGSAAAGPSMYMDHASVTGTSSITDNTAILQYSLVAQTCGSSVCVTTPASPSTGYFIGGDNLFTTTNTNVIGGSGVAVLSGSNFLGSSGVAIAGTVIQAPLAQLPQGVIKPSGVLVSGLSASLPVKTDASKNLVSAAINLASSTEVTGTTPINKGGTNNASAYTAGSVVYSDGTSLTQNNSNLFWDNSNTRLGISTAAPAHKLHVAASATSGAQAAVENRENTTATAAATLLLKRSRGTAGSPTAVLSGDSLGFFGVTGFGATTYPTNANSGMLGVATENHSDTVKGGKLAFRITPNGGLLNRNAIEIDQDGSLGFKGLTSGTLSVNVPATVTSHTLILPSAQGAANTFMKNDGSGNLSWFLLPTFITNSGAIDFASTLAGSSDDQTLTVTGAIVGDVVTCGKPADQDANLTVECFVSAADTVTFRAHNVSVAVTVDQASKTYKATIIR